MKVKRLIIFLAVIIILVDLAYFYPRLTGKVTEYRIEIAIITRIIDGDTIETNIGEIRLLGVNTPEKKQDFYEEARDFLKRYENKTVKIENRGKDKYDRILGHVFYDSELINKEILEKGLGSLYVYKKDNYFSDLQDAEKYARENEFGIWKKSENYGCVKLINLKYIEQERCKNQEQLILENKCSSLNLTLKDDANHIYKLNLSRGIFTKNFSCVFNDEGDSLFLRDDEGLVLYYSY